MRFTTYVPFTRPMFALLSKKASVLGMLTVFVTPRIVRSPVMMSFVFARSAVGVPIGRMVFDRNVITGNESAQKKAHDRR